MKKTCQDYMEWYFQEVQVIFPVFVQSIRLQFHQADMKYHHNSYKKYNWKGNTYVNYRNITPDKGLWSWQGSF